MASQSYQKIFALATSIFYALLTVFGLIQLPAVFITYFPNYVGDALLGFCFLMVVLYGITLIAIYWD